MLYVASDRFGRLEAWARECLGAVEGALVQEARLPRVSKSRLPHVLN